MFKEYHKPKRKSQVSTDYLCTPGIYIFPTFFLTSAFETTFRNSSMNLSTSPDNFLITVFFMWWLQLYFTYTGKLPVFVRYIEKGRVYTG